MIFVRTLADGTEQEYALVDSVVLGETIDDEWRALLDGQTTLSQWLHDVGSVPGDSVLLVRRVGG